MNIASIDVGTNTILLLIAQIDLHKKLICTLHEEIRMPRIGEYLYETGKISDGKIDELENILLEYKCIVENYNCSQCFVIGTHALRAAANKLAIQKRIYNKTSFLIEIISPETEAEFAFHGVKSAISFNDTFAILDIGGGSTEIIIGKNDEIVERKSIPVGVVTLKDSFISRYPIAEDERSKLRDKLEIEFKKLNFKQYAPKTLIGISGTPTTLSGIINKLKVFNPVLLENTSISINEIHSVFNFLGNSSLKKIRRSYGEIISKREDILYVGCEILLYLMSYFQLSNVMISAKGIRHGVIYKKMFMAS
ncbi:MAG: hypothetical protein GW788_07155 [Ignavibacteria bacterium]|nr:hypothetical protein [Ignavibacteria bacterium]